MTTLPLPSEFTCVICGFDAHLDDAIAPSVISRKCICLRCYSRELDDQKRADKALIREVEDAEGERADGL